MVSSCWRPGLSTPSLGVTQHRLHSQLQVHDCHSCWSFWSTNIVRLPLVKVTAVDGGEPEIEVIFFLICLMFLLYGSIPSWLKPVFSYRWMMIQVLLVALMWQEPHCWSPSQGQTYSNRRSLHFKSWFNFCLCRIGNHCIVDSSPEEESCSSASLVVAVTPDGSISTLRKVTNKPSKSFLVERSAHWGR